MRSTAANALDPQAGCTILVVGDTYRIVAAGDQTG